MSDSVKSIQWGQEKIKKIIIYQTVTSTNDLAKTQIREGCPSGIVLWSMQQTAGRGRQGRTWDANQTSLTFSLLWQVSNETNLGILPLVIGLGIVQKLEKLVPDVKVKWPNDLWVGERKLAGILGETIRQQGKLWAVLGVGINVNNLSNPASQQRISLREATGEIWSRLAILDVALQGMEEGLTLAEGSSMNLTYLFRRYGNFIDQPVLLVQGGRSWPAKALDVLEDGRLLIEDAQGVRALLPDEISLRF